MSVTQVYDDAQFGFDKPTLVCFSALAWCVPCQRFKPHYEAASNVFPDVNFLEVDADTCQDLVAEYNVRSVPTVIFFDGTSQETVTARTAGSLTNYLKDKLGND